jgi:predicted Zn finger-like uncharacterized protein
MKITCESCQAKYSIADEKVAGRVFKIRCKRCGEVIVVKGDEEALQQAPASQATGPAGDAIWHVVINGEQFGPYEPAQIGELLANGQIDWEAYVWREGFDNWLPACEVNELVTAISGSQPQSQAAVARTPASDIASYSVPPEGEQPTSIFDKANKETAAVLSSAARPKIEPASMGADPFAEDAHASGETFGEPARDAGADVFSREAAASPFDGGDGYASNEGVVASGSSPRVGSARAMTGARNENSVLFSLKNLQALATGSTSVSMPPPVSGPQPRAGLASGEGSGLIDIRALANAAGIGQSDEQFGNRDELLSMGSKTGAFGSLGSPMAPALSSEDGGKNKVIFAVLGGAAVLAVAMIAVAFIVRNGQKEPSAPAVAALAPSNATNPAGPAVKASNTESKNTAIAPEKLSEGELAARNANETSEDKKGESKKGSSRKKKSDEEKPASENKSNESASSNTSSKQSESAPSAKKRSTGNESIDDLLSGALSGGGSKPKKEEEKAAPAGPPLPTKPSRDDVLKSLRDVQPAVQACAKGQAGSVAMADIVVASSGRVKSVQVTQVTGPLASCIAKEVRKARFPQFSMPEFSVSFPFRL